MKKRMFWVALLVTALAILGGAMTLSHRSAPDKKVLPETAAGVVSQDQRAKAEARSREFDTETLTFERKLVKEEPFSATLMIEQFPEGTSEPRTTTSLIYRDDEGRTRRDQMQANSNATDAETTTINDPVAGFTYLIKHKNSTARRTKLSAHADEKSTDSIAVMQKAVSSKQHSGTYKMLPAPVSGGSEKGLKQQTAAAAAQAGSRSESIGEREIEGVATEGTRTTVTIPAGALGNEREVQIVTERWYSPKLQTVVLIERFDPRFGRSVYKLTGIKTIDPAASLFTVPGNYKIIVE